MLIMASFLLSLVAFTKNLTSYIFCAGWVWGYLNEIPVLWEVMYLLLSLDHHPTNSYVKAVLVVHPFACHWACSKNVNFALCKCLILWLYLNSGLWLFLDFTLSSIKELAFYLSLQGWGVCDRGGTETVTRRCASVSPSLHSRCVTLKMSQTFWDVKLGENTFFMGLRLYNFQGSFLYIISFYIDILQIRTLRKKWFALHHGTNPW